MGLEDAVELIDAKTIAELGAEARAGVAYGLTSAISGAIGAALDQLPGLRVVASVGAGTDLFDLEDLASRGITLCPTPDVMTEDTADYAVALVLALLRNLVANDRFVRSGAWSAGRACLGWRPSGRRVGVGGLGRIGRRVAQKLDALGCTVSYTGRAPKDVTWQFEPDVGALAETVDVLVLCCSGGPETRAMVGGAVLRQLGPEGFLVNVSRGSVVDEPALIEALEQGKIAGAALDVFENEPTPDPRFFDLPTCILSPHAAVFTRENRRDLIADIRRLLGVED